MSVEARHGTEAPYFRTAADSRAEGIAGRVRGCSLKKHLPAQYRLGQPSEGFWTGEEEPGRWNRAAGAEARGIWAPVDSSVCLLAVSLSPASIPPLFRRHPVAAAARLPSAIGHRPWHAMCSAHTGTPSCPSRSAASVGVRHEHPSMAPTLDRFRDSLRDEVVILGGSPVPGEHSAL